MEAPTQVRAAVADFTDRAIASGHRRDAELAPFAHPR